MKREDVSWEHLLTLKPVLNHGRMRINYRNYGYLLSHVVWNINNPDDIVKSDEAIHHIDEDPLNNDISNFSKMTRREHAKFHKPMRTHCSEGHEMVGENLNVYERIRKGRLGYQYQCKICVKARNKASYEKNKERRKAQSRANYKKRKEEDDAELAQIRKDMGVGLI